MEWYALIGDRSLVFGSRLAEAKFYELKGKPVRIALDDKPTAEMRRFFEGACVPYIFYQSGSAWRDFKECREAIKLEFLPGWTRAVRGKRVRRIRYARSTTELSKAGFRRFLEAVLRWMELQGMEVPDSEDWKRWRDSAAEKGEIYPPLARLISVHHHR